MRTSQRKPLRLFCEDMKKSQFTKTIPGNFTYFYIDDKGEDRQEVINYTVKVNSFRESVTEYHSKKQDEIEDNPEALADLLASRLHSWDIIDDDTGEPLSFDKETLVALPDTFLMQLSQSMTELIGKTNPTKQPPANSPDGSELAEA